MPETSTIVLFVGAALVLLLTPGPAVLYIVGRSLEQGRPAGVVSAAGMAVGTMFHVTAAVLGLSALIMSSITAFSVLKYAGAAYLIYLGVKRLFFREDPEEPDGRSAGGLTTAFRQAVVVNVLNPKTALFFVAFLPQFVDPSKGSVVGQVLFLGALLIAMGFCSDSLYALLAGSLRGPLKRGASAAPRYVSGGIYIGLGVLTAFSSISRK